MTRNHFWVAAICAMFSGINAYAQQQLPTISGRLTNEAKKPCTNAEVRLLDEKGNLLKSLDSDDQGSFEFTHKECHKCILEIIPGENTGLATALIDNVAGDQNRSFVVELHHGFVVSGRVTSEGRGLKGIVIKVSPVDLAARHVDVHGGGFAITGRNGQFHMTLTPGTKKLQLFNTKYEELVERYNQQFTVTSDLILADMSLPPAK